MVIVITTNPNNPVDDLELETKKRNLRQGGKTRAGQQFIDFILSSLVDDEIWEQY